MATVIALCGQKGGSGKTTLAENISSELLARGHRVLLVDSDPQGSARTWAEVASEGGHPSPTVVGMGADLHKSSQLPKLLEAFDWVVIDSPPRHEEVHRAAMMMADLVLVPCGPGAHDIWALSETTALVETAQRTRRELKAGVVITRKVASTSIGKGAREALEGGLPVLKSELGFRVAFQEAPAVGLGVTGYAPTSEAADEVRALVDEVMELARKGGKKRR